MFYIPGDFAYQPTSLKAINRFSWLLERKECDLDHPRRRRNDSRRVKTIEMIVERTKRCSLPTKQPKKVQLPAIGEKRFVLKGSPAQHSPIRKVSLRRLELQNKLGLPHSRVQRQKTCCQTDTNRNKSIYYALRPWHHEEEEKQI